MLSEKEEISSSNVSNASSTARVNFLVLSLCVARGSTSFLPCGPRCYGWAQSWGLSYSLIECSTELDVSPLKYILKNTLLWSENTMVLKSENTFISNNMAMNINGKTICILLLAVAAVCTWLTSWIVFGGSTGEELRCSGSWWSCWSVDLFLFVLEWSTLIKHPPIHRDG